MRLLAALSLFAATALAGCVAISNPPEDTTVATPVHVQAVVATPSQDSNGDTVVKPGDRQTKAEIRIDGVLKTTITPSGGPADAINVDRSYTLPAGAHTLVIKGYEVDGDTSESTRRYTVGSPGAISHVVWVFFENHGYNQVRNTGEFKRLADTYGEATNFFAHTHPSQPNYIYATAGDQCGITSNDLSTCAAENIFHQVGDSQWRSYQESMPRNCDRVTTGPSPVKHDPARTFTNIDCATNDVPLPANPTFSRKFYFVTPNMCNSAHDCPIESASDFLASFTPKVLNSPEYRAGNLLFVVTLDEEEFTEGNHVYTALINEAARGKRAGTHYDFCNLLATTEDLLRVGRIGCAAGVPSMASAFGLRAG
jgi:hypothetical protein